MSYCRWSSGNWRCDLYCYADCSGGFTTHVAGRKRIIPPIPEISMLSLPFPRGKWDQEQRKMVYANRWQSLVAKICSRIWSLSHRLSMWSLSVIPLRDIGLPHDGKSFNDETLEEFKERITWLRAEGYYIPEACYQGIMEETEENHTEMLDSLNA